MKVSECIALGEYLSEWPPGQTFEEIIESLHAATNFKYPAGVVPCEFFEDWYPPALGERIDSLAFIVQEALDDQN